MPPALRIYDLPWYELILRTLGKEADTHSLYRDPVVGFPTVVTTSGCVMSPKSQVGLVGLPPKPAGALKTQFGDPIKPPGISSSENEVRGEIKKLICLAKIIWPPQFGRLLNRANKLSWCSGGCDQKVKGNDLLVASVFLLG